MPFGTSFFGLSPFGSIPDYSVDFSSPDPFAGIIRDWSYPLSLIAYCQPYDTIDKIRVAVTLGDGFASQPDDTLPDSDHTPLPNALFRVGLTSPYSYSVSIMENGLLAQAAQTSRGSIGIENLTHRFDYLKDLDWEQAPILLMVGRSDRPLSEFTTVFDGLTGAINGSGGDEFFIPLLDYSKYLQSPVIKSTYRGMNASVRGNGTSSVISGTVPKPSGSFSLEFYIRPQSSALSQKSLLGWRNGSSPGTCEIRFSGVGGVNNNPEIYIVNDSGTQYTLSGISTNSTYLEPYYNHYIGLVLDSVAHILYLYVCDEVTGGLATFSVNVAGNFTTVLNTLVGLRRADATSNYADADIFQIRIWSGVALDQATIIRYKDRPIDILHPFYASLSHYYPTDEGIGGTLFDTIGGANLTLTNTLWVGSLEGDGSLTGQTPPIWEGKRRQIEPVSVDSQNYVYEVSRGPSASTITDVQIKGDGSGLSSSGSVSDIYSVAPASGHYITAYMGGRNLLRLNAAPSGVLTCTVISDTLDAAGVIKKIATGYMGFPTDRINLESFAYMSATFPETIGDGRRLESINGWDLMQEIAYRSHAQIFMTRKGMLAIRKLEKPGTGTITISEIDAVMGTTVIQSRTIGARSVCMSFRPYQTTQDATNSASGLSPAVKLDLAQPIRYVNTPPSNKVLQFRPNAQDITPETSQSMATLYDDPDQAYSESLQRADIWENDWVTITLQLTRGMFLFDIWNMVTVSILDANGVDYIEGLNGVDGAVVGINEDWKSGSTSVTIWILKKVFKTIITDLGFNIVTDDGQPLLREVVS